MDHPKKFSLVESLAAVGIIIVMSAMLFPLLENAGHKTGPSEMGKSDLLAASILQYATDHEGMYPIGCGQDLWQATAGGWCYGLLPYIGKFQRLVEARDPLNQGSWPSYIAGHPDAVNISYATNGYMATDDSGIFNLNGVIGVDLQPEFAPWFGNGVRAVAEVTYPADTIMVAQAYNCYPVYLSSNIITGIDNWDANTGFGGLLPDPRRDGEPYVVNGYVQTLDNRNGAVNATYANGQNRFIWCDGHITYQPPVATNPAPNDRHRNRWDAIRP